VGDVPATRLVLTSRRGALAAVVVAVWSSAAVVASAAAPVCVRLRSTGALLGDRALAEACLPVGTSVHCYVGLVGLPETGGLVVEVCPPEGPQNRSS
jgi:hypothetical protein